MKSVASQSTLSAFELVLLPARQQAVLTHPCTSCGPAKLSPAWPDQDFPAGSACSLLLNPGGTVNHTNSDREIHTDVNMYPTQL